MDNSVNEILSFNKNISKRNFFTINDISSIAKASSYFSVFSSISKEYNVLCSSFYNFSVRKRISVINLSNLFNGCSSLELIKDINYWNIKDSINMSSMFKECKSLVSLPYISLWRTNNVLDMSYLFCGCSLLTSLPDISKWNIDNVINMSYIFYNCSSLITLPDISKWKKMINALRILYLMDAHH